MKRLPLGKTAEDVVHTIFKHSVPATARAVQEDVTHFVTVRFSYRGQQFIVPVAGSEDAAQYVAEELADEFVQYWLTKTLGMPEGSLDEEFQHCSAFEVLGV